MEFLPFFTRPPLSSIRRWQLLRLRREKPADRKFLCKISRTYPENEADYIIQRVKRSIFRALEVFFFIHMEYHAFALSWWRLDKVRYIIV